MMMTYKVCRYCNAFNALLTISKNNFRALVLETLTVRRIHLNIHFEEKYRNYLVPLAHTPVSYPVESSLALCTLPFSDHSSALHSAPAASMSQALQSGTVYPSFPNVKAHLPSYFPPSSKNSSFPAGLPIPLALSFLRLRYDRKQVSKVIWQKAASPTCHPSRLQMGSSDLDPI